MLWGTINRGEGELNGGGLDVFPVLFLVAFCSFFVRPLTLFLFSLTLGVGVLVLGDGNLLQ